MSTVYINGRKYETNGKTINEEDLSGIVEIKWEGPVANITSSASVSVNGDVSGHIDADGSVDCRNVSEYVSAGGSAKAGDVYGNVSAGGSIACGNVKGNVIAGGSVMRK